jgi:hypothetical protein
MLYNSLVELVISAGVIGTHEHLVYDGDEWRWSNIVPPGCLLWGFDHHRDLREAAAALRIDVPDFKNTSWGKAQMYVQDDLSDVKWRFCMPFLMWKSVVTEIVDQLWRHFTDESNRYYISTLLRNREIACQLQRPIIREATVRNYCIGASGSVRQNLEKFLPDSSGYAPRSFYSFCRTITGRMTIINGPNILTMKKESRKIIESRYIGGKIVEIDLQSAEPRVALALFGKTIDGDVYSRVMKDVNVEISREAAKIATLSAIYGASHHALKSRLPNGLDSIRVLEEVKDYFGVRHLESMLKEQHSENGCTFNTHGRKIFSDSPSVNHLIQSSTVDISHDVFELLIEALRDHQIKFCPLYLIHDAILLDVDGDDLNKLRDICEKGFVSHVVKTNFPVKVKEIN